MDEGNVGVSREQSPHAQHITGTDQLLAQASKP